MSTTSQGLPTWIASELVGDYAVAGTPNFSVANRQNSATAESTGLTISSRSPLLDVCDTATAAARGPLLGCVSTLITEYGGVRCSRSTTCRPPMVKFPPQSGHRIAGDHALDDLHYHQFFDVRLREFPVPVEQR